jgi:hypothetical protein
VIKKVTHHVISNIMLLLLLFINITHDIMSREYQMKWGIVVGKQSSNGLYISLICMYMCNAPLDRKSSIVVPLVMGKGGNAGGVEDV